MPVAGSPRGSSSSSDASTRNTLTPPSLPVPDEGGDALAVVRRRAGQRTVDGDPPQEQMEIVLERHPDAPVQLHAVLHQLGAVLADVGLGRADQLGRVLGSPVRRGGAGGSR